MSDEQPPQYVAYPRGHHGSSEKLIALADGYAGLSRVFAGYVLANVMLVIGGLLTTYSLSVLELFIIGFTIYFTKRPIRQFGKELEWSERKILNVNALMGGNLFCCGIFGFGILQWIAARELTSYHLRLSFAGVPKDLLAAKVAELRQAESMLPPRD